MKRINTIILTLMLGESSVYAQPGSVQKVAKSVFTLTTFNKDGAIISSTQGVFIDNKGTAISTFKPFVGATKASVVDATGKSYEVDAIMGADELYDVAKFRIKANTAAATIAAKETEAGQKVWLVPYSIKKSPFQQESITSVEKFLTSYNYYIFSTGVPENAVGCPFVNKNGQVIGLMHSNGQTTAIDANYASQLKVSGLSSLDAALRETSIRTALPDTEQEAMTMMTLKKGQLNMQDYDKYADEFIEKFPTSAFGYKEKALGLVNDSKYEEAARMMETGIKKSAAKDEAHSNYSDIIYQKIIYKGDSVYTAWTMDKALDEARQAYAIKAQPVYKHQEARILFTKGEYADAANIFLDLTKTPINSGELYLEAAQAKTRLKAPDSEIEMLLDSAVSVGARTNMAGPYYLARGQYLANKGQYRRAVQDFNMYDSIARPVDPAFFYARYQCETKLRMWQPALFDIARTCYLAPKEPTFFAEWASLDLRVKRYDEGISAASRCIELAPEYADGYLLLGLLYKEKNMKAEAIKNLKKAEELGDKRAAGYLEKIKK